MPAIAAVATVTPTQTSLSVETHERDGRTQAALSMHVSAADEQVGGVVAIDEGGRQLGSTTLDADGNATLNIDLTGGEHSLRAVYLGDETHRGSVSQAAGVHAEASSAPDFSISVSPSSLTLPVGQSGSVIAAIKPVNNASLSAPMFVTLSCSGLPDESSCTFTPENIEILSSSCPNPSAASCPINSSMVLVTQLGTGSLARPADAKTMEPIALAIVLPGALALLGLASRRRTWLRNASLGVLAGVVVILSATACNSRYDYFHHGPPPNPSTPTGTYKLTITAQSNNGITATTHSTTMVLTIK